MTLLLRSENPPSPGCVPHTGIGLLLHVTIIMSSAIGWYPTSIIWKKETRLRTPLNRIDGMIKKDSHHTITL